MQIINYAIIHICAIRMSTCMGVEAVQGYTLVGSELHVGDGASVVVGIVSIYDLSLVFEHEIKGALIRAKSVTIVFRVTTDVLCGATELQCFIDTFGEIDGLAIDRTVGTIQNILSVCSCHIPNITYYSRRCGKSTSAISCLGLSQSVHYGQEHNNCQQAKTFCKCL